MYFICKMKRVHIFDHNGTGTVLTKISQQLTLNYNIIGTRRQHNQCLLHIDGYNGMPILRIKINEVKLKQWENNRK